MSFSNVMETLRIAWETGQPFWIVTKADQALYCNYFRGELWVYDDDWTTSKHVPVYDLLHEIKFVLPCY